MKSFRKFILILFTIYLIFNININLSYAVTPLSSPNYQGIDVSNWQGDIDYTKVKDDGIEIVYIKSSQGNNIKDPYFERNYRDAKDKRLKVGVYHFLTARTTDEAREEAEFFCSVISDKSIDCKLAMDFEEFGNLSKREINDISREFLRRVKDITKKDLVIYSDLSNAINTFDKDLADKYPLWLAYYDNYNRLNNVNTSWNHWIGVQYTDRGIVNGVSGNLDRDLFTKEIFLSDNSKIPSSGNSNITPSSPSKTGEVNHIVHTVKRRDSVWKIAKEHGVTVKHVVALNNIKNPNLIFPGDKLRITSNKNLIPKEEQRKFYIPNFCLCNKDFSFSEISLTLNLKFMEWLN